MRFITKQLLPLFTIAFALSTSSCGSDKTAENDNAKDALSKKYAKDLVEIKTVFCACMESGKEVRACEAEANDLISESKDRLELSDEEWRQMTVDAGAAMRECVE
jgi:hypothetical protein